MTGPNQPGLYVIIDVIAQAIVQNVITISRHEAPMVRMFTDLLSGKGPIAEHPADYQLVRVGYIDENHELTGCTPFQVVLTGAQWARLHREEQPGFHNGGGATPGTRTAELMNAQ